MLVGYYLSSLVTLEKSWKIEKEYVSSCRLSLDDNRIGLEKGLGIVLGM